MEQHYQTFVGIDLSAYTADIAVMQSAEDKPILWTVKQTKAGFEQLQKKLTKITRQPHTCLIAMEATGAYWRKMARFLNTQGYTVSVLNPTRAHHFAKSLPRRDKTDEQDAVMLCKMALTTYAYLPIYITPSPIFDEVYQLLQQRDALTHISVQQVNRRHSFNSHTDIPLEAVVERDDALTFLVKQQRRRIDKELKLVFADDEEWKPVFDCLMSVTGIGVICASWLMYVTQGFTLFDDAKQLASFVGLVPRRFQSGTSIKRKDAIGHAGHPRLRQILYNSAMSAIQNDPRMKQFYKRLIMNGKPKKVALIAVSHKLVRICWAVGTKREVYNTAYLNVSGTAQEIETEQ